MGWNVVVAVVQLLALADQQRSVQLCVKLIDRASLSARSVSVLKSEVSQIWSRTGHQVVWERVGMSCPSLRPPLSVVIAPGAERPLPRSVLATIQFAHGRPADEIHAYKDRIDALLEREFRRHGPPFFVAGRDELLGRILGRAIAHEVGHYLLRSNAHTHQGLMKEWHNARDLISKSDKPFALDAVSHSALRSSTQ